MRWEWGCAWWEYWVASRWAAAAAWWGCERRLTPVALLALLFTVVVAVTLSDVATPFSWDSLFWLRILSCDWGCISLDWVSLAVDSIAFAAHISVCICCCCCCCWSSGLVVTTDSVVTDDDVFETGVSNSTMLIWASPFGPTFTTLTFYILINF